MLISPLIRPLPPPVSFISLVIKFRSSFFTSSLQGLKTLNYHDHCYPFITLEDPLISALVSSLSTDVLLLYYLQSYIQYWALARSIDNEEFGVTK